MRNYYRKYLILAIIGSIIIGLAFYLLLNNYLDKKEIIVASKNINAGEKICEDDLNFKEYYKNSLPKNYLTNKKDIIGKIINIERREDDYISNDMFGKEKEENIFDSLSVGDVVIAVNVQYIEPLLLELKAGDCISIVSTISDKDLIYSDYLKPSNISDDKNVNQNNYYNYENRAILKNNYSFSRSDYIDDTTFNLSENVILINGQMMVRNLEIICIEKNVLNDNKNILLNNNNNNITSVYLKCDIKEAPIIAKLTKDKDYKIIVEDI